MPKRAATEIGCNSFDQLDLQSLNNDIIVFGLAIETLGGWEHVI